MWFGWWRTWMIRDLDDKGLGKNKVLCSSLGIELPWSTTMQAPWQRSLRQGDRSLAICRLLAIEPHWLGFLLVASSLSPLLCCLFFVASSLSPHLAHILACFGALRSASCRLPSLLFGGELDCWLSHGQSRVQGCWCCCRLLRVVLVEGADYLPEVYDGRRRFSDAFFF